MSQTLAYLKWCDGIMKGLGMKTRGVCITLAGLILVVGCQAAQPFTATPSKTPPPQGIKIGVGVPEPSTATLLPTSSNLTGEPGLSVSSTPALPSYSPTSEPGLSASGTPTPEPTPGLFTLSPANPQPGAPLTFSWDLTGSWRTESGHCLVVTSTGSDLTDHAVKSWCNLPDIGSLTITLPTVDRDRFRVYLGREELEVRLPCPDDYFFGALDTVEGWRGAFATDYCPDSPVSSDAVEQRFERGRMLWLKGQIYVLQEADGAGNALQTFDAIAAAGGSPLEPPAGRFPPDADHFRQVWDTQTVWWSNQTLREALGWATAPSRSFQTVIQRPWVTSFGLDTSGAIINQSQPDSSFQYVRLADGQAIFLSRYVGHGARPGWAYVSP